MIKSRLIFSAITVLLLNTNVFGSTNALGEEAPAPDGTKFFNESTINGNANQITVQGIDEDNNNIVGDDTLPDSNIETGLSYTNNFGDPSEGVNVVNEEGNSLYLNRNEDGSIPSFVGLETLADNDNPDLYENESYTTWKESYESYFMEDDMSVKRAREHEAKKEGMTLNFSLKNNLNEYTNRYLGGNNIASGGQNVSTSFRTNINREGTDEKLIEAEEGATALYKDLYGSGVNKSDRENVLNTSYGALNKAYEGIDAITEELTNRLTGATIKCQISRQLVPSYKCGLPGKEGLRYPSSPDMSDIRKVNILEAKEMCNDDCWTDPGELTCVDQQVIPSDTINVGLPDTGMVLFPNWTEANSTMDTTTTKLMPVDYLKIKVELLNPQDSGLTDEEWKVYLADTKFKFRYSVLEVESDVEDILPITIIDREVFQIRGDISELEVPINRPMNAFRIKFWKPFITNNAFRTHEFQEKFDYIEGLGAELKITYLEAKYESDSYYFCQAKQMVSAPSECVGGEFAEFVTGDDQFNYICNADSKKIGPEPTWGAFYSQEKCETSCVIHKECTPTYRHYTSYGDDDFIYKAEVGCVDDTDNTHCSNAICEDFFGDPDERPINEIVVTNDDTYIYTIKNKVIQDYPRPKIDLAAELAASVDYDQVFQNEQKDSAYLYMIDNIRFNRIAYRVGTASPHNLSYKKESNGLSGNIYSVDLKPNSFHIDNGKEYYIYSIVRMDQSYAPIAGAWYLGGNNVTATQQFIQWRDYTYLIKTGENEGDWKTFRKEEFAEFLQKITKFIMNEDGSVSEYESIEWAKTNQYRQNNYAFYNPVDNVFTGFDSSDEAEYFKVQEFTSDQDYHRYTITNNSNVDFLETPGSLIRNQRAISHDTDFEKLYNVDSNYIYKGSPKDYMIYLVYSETKLSYEELMIKIEGTDYNNNKVLAQNNQWGAYSLITSNLFRSDSIKYDGEINNDINTLIMGTPENSTVSVDWDPSLSEKGKKVFKYIFLYDDNEPNSWDYTNDDGSGADAIQSNQN